MLYPPYPEIDASDPETDQTAAYDLFAAVGLHPLPKLASNKMPVPEVWDGQKRIPSREEALSLQEKPSSRGWFIVPSMEPDVRLVILDLDTADLKKHTDVLALYDRIQAMSLSRFVIYTPAGGVHLFYQLAEGQEAPNGIHPRKEYPGLDLRSPAIEVGVATLGGDALYSSGVKKGVPDGFRGFYRRAPFGEYGSIPYISEQLLSWLKEGDKVVSLDVLTDERATDAQRSFSKLSADDQEKLAHEALTALLDKWTPDRSYEDWMRMWMSAHVASGGSETLMNLITGHPNIPWSDGNKGRRKFQRDWRSHEAKLGGLTPGTLFFMAFEAGWMQKSTAEVETFDIKIDVPYVSDWISTTDDLPKHCLLTAQTGSGKTYGLKSLWERLDKPRTLVFVPSIKLAFDMASTLRDELGLPAVAYRSEETMETLSETELRSAHILVTTLQTFTRKLYVEGTGQLRTYGLVYLEECDQLLQQFSKSLGEDASHITQEQAENGFLVLRDAMKESGAVWGVDATMTRVSLNCFHALSPTVKTVINEHLTVKPAVTFLKDKLEAYGKIYEALAAGKSVVVPCDTKAEAETVVEAMRELAVVSEDESLAVTADTGAVDCRVVEFARNANLAAPQYRLVAYNSAMASGVSVTSFRPDVVVQLVSGYLTPRVNLQILNRYRKQAEVFCYYNGRRDLKPARDITEILTSARDRAAVEAELLYIPLPERSELASLRDTLRALAALDESAQRRAPQWFYRRLVEQDGRPVIEAVSGNVAARVEGAVDDAREARAARRERLARIWRDTPAERDPVKMPASYTADEKRAAIVHQWIKDVLNDNVPQEVPAQYVYETVRSLYKKVGALTAFVFQSRLIRDMEKSLVNRERAYLSLSAGVSRTILAALLRYLFETPEEVLTPEILLGRTMPFLRVMKENKRLYAAVIRDPEKSLKALREKHKDDQKFAIEIAKNVARAVGLKIIKKKEEGWHIGNLQEVLDLLRWRYMGHDIDLQFTKAGIEQQQEFRKQVQHLYKDLQGEDQDRFLARLSTMPLEVALYASSF